MRISHITLIECSQISPTWKFINANVHIFLQKKKILEMKEPNIQFNNSQSKTKVNK